MSFSLRTKTLYLTYNGLNDKISRTELLELLKKQLGGFEIELFLIAFNPKNETAGVILILNKVLRTVNQKRFDLQIQDKTFSGDYQAVAKEPSKLAEKHNFLKKQDLNCYTNMVDLNKKPNNNKNTNDDFRRVARILKADLEENINKGKLSFASEVKKLLDERLDAFSENLNAKIDNRLNDFNDRIHELEKKLNDL